MTEKRPTRRRWFQFSLRTLLVVIMLVAFGGGWIGMQLQEKRRHEAVVNEIVKLGGRVSVKGNKLPAWKEWLFGKYAVSPVDLNLEHSDANDSLLFQIRGMNVVSLDLHATKVTDAGLTYLKRLTSLHCLSLSSNGITDAGLENLKGVTGIQSLSLSNNQITDAGLTHLKGLTGLKGLGLGRNQITDAGLTHLKRMTNLESLDLRYTQTTEAGLAQLNGLNKLEVLRPNKMTKAGVDRLKQASPNCQIIY